MSNSVWAKVYLVKLEPLHLLKDFLEAALQAEIEEHLDEEQRFKGNRKNGHGSKELKTSEGTLDLSPPRDRNAEFEQQP